MATDLRNLHVFALPSVSLNAKPTYGDGKRMIEGLIFESTICKAEQQDNEVIAWTFSTTCGSQVANQSTSQNKQCRAHAGIKTLKTESRVGWDRFIVVCPGVFFE